MEEKKKVDKKEVSKAALTKKVVKKATVKKTAAEKIPVAKKTVVEKKTTLYKKAESKAKSKPGPALEASTSEEKEYKKSKPLTFVAVEHKPKSALAQHSEKKPNQQPKEFNTPSNWQDRYGDNRIVLMIRDPYWCFVYWDLSSDRQAEAIKETQHSGVKLMLRIYDVTDIAFDGSNAHRFMDIEISEEATNWYINVWAADCAYCVDLGLLYPDGKFVTIVRSNIVTTPRDSVSSVIDEEWMVVDETFERLYQTSGANDPGRSSEAILKYMLKRVRADVTSGGLASMSSEGGRPKPSKSEDFWLVVNTELIVYGATEPDAKVTLQGKPLRLNQDGTFSVRFALPDGKQVIPVKAVNSTGTQERIITPSVEKHTE